MKVLLHYMQEILRSSDSLRGYRAVWKILREKYGIQMKRYYIILYMLRLCTLRCMVSVSLTHACIHVHAYDCRHSMLVYMLCLCS